MSHPAHEAESGKEVDTQRKGDSAVRKASYVLLQAWDFCNFFFINCVCACVFRIKKKKGFTPIVGSEISHKMKCKANSKKSEMKGFCQEYRIIVELQES